MSPITRRVFRQPTDKKNPATEHRITDQSPAITDPNNGSSKQPGIHQYSEEYYDKIVKKMLDDPQIDKAQLVKRLLSHIQSQDFSFL